MDRALKIGFRFNTCFLAHSPSSITFDHFSPTRSTHKGGRQGRGVEGDVLTEAILKERTKGREVWWEASLR